MKKILVPTDFSTQAENALKVAVQLAKKFDSEIYLIHMLELPIHDFDFINGHGVMPEALFFIKLAEQRFDDLMNSKYLKDVKVHKIVKNYPSLRDIANTCIELDINLIVMGSHGASGLTEMFIGSNAEKVVRTSEVPVLVVKNHLDVSNIKHFVFASNFKKENVNTYQEAIKFANALGSKMHLLMVNTVTNFMSTYEAKKRIEDFVKDFDFENFTITVYDDKNIETGILNFAEKINADLIGISTHGRQGIAHFLSGSIGEDVVNHAKRPVITFKI